MPHLSYSVNSLKGGYIGEVSRGIKEDTRSVDIAHIPRPMRLKGSALNFMGENLGSTMALSWFYSLEWVSVDM